MYNKLRYYSKYGNELKKSKKIGYELICEKISKKEEYYIISTGIFIKMVCGYRAIIVDRLPSIINDGDEFISKEYEIAFRTTEDPKEYLNKRVANVIFYTDMEPDLLLMNKKKDIFKTRDNDDYNIVYQLNNMDRRLEKLGDCLEIESDSD